MNDAIINCFVSGCLTSATLLVNAQSTLDAIEKSKQYPALAVGLHFNLTLGRPVSSAADVSSIVDKAGRFFSRAVLARKIFLHLVKKEHIELELTAQYSRMESAGLNPSHVDSHQHIHGFSFIFDAVASLCERKDIPMRVPWILKLDGEAIPLRRRIKQSILGHMLTRNTGRWRGRVKWNCSLVSIFDLGEVPDELNIDHYRKLLASDHQGLTELMVHPVTDARQVEGLTRIGELSEREFVFLKSGKLASLASALDFTSATYRDL